MTVITYLIHKNHELTGESTMALPVRLSPKLIHYQPPISKQPDKDKSIFSFQLNRERRKMARKGKII